MSLPAEFATGSGQPSFGVLEEAADWFALLRSGAATDQDRTAWLDWLAHGPDRRAAWRCVQEIGQRFEPIRSAQDPRPATAALQSLAGRRPGRRQVVSGLVLGCIAGAVGWTWQDEAWTADHRTAVGEVRELSLPDGSRVWLNTDTALDADYGPATRLLRLRRGEILVQTAAEPGRPFLVETSAGRMRALGTRFCVRTAGGQTRLAVYAGAVEVHPRSGERARVVAAGEQLRFDQRVIGAAAAADRAREAWTRGVLLAEDITLQALVDELQRYRRGHIAVAPEVARLRVLGGYPLADTDRALSMLEAVLPVTVRRPLPWWVSIGPRAAAG